MKRRFLSTLMALVLALSLVPTAALAAEGDETQVAQIGDKTYTSLSSAMFDFGANDTLVLLANCETSYLQLPNNSVIDLNGHDLTYTGSTTIIFSGSGRETTITDSTASGQGTGGTLKITGQRDGAQSVFEIGNATLNISNINIDSTGCVFYPHGNSAVLNITNSDIKTKGVYCVSTNAGDPAYYGVTINIVGSSLTADAENKDDCAVMMNVSGSLNIEDSVITGNRQGVFARAGNVTIVDSEIVVTGAWAGTDAGESYNGTWQSGNEVPTSALIVGNSSDNANSYNADARATISNTKITASQGSVPAIYVDANDKHAASVSVSGSETVVTGDIKNQETSEKASIVVTGGQFLDGKGTVNESVKDYFPENSSLKIDKKTGNVVTDDESTVAEVGGVPYKFLQAAIDAAGIENTVILQQDTEENVTVAQDKDIIFDLNGFTLNGGTDPVGGPENNKAALTNYGTIVIQDSSNPSTGLIRRDDHDIGGYYVIDNQGTMTIESGSVYNNTGTMPTGSSLIRNYSADAETKASLTITGGHIQQDGFIAVKNDDNGILNITGGTIVTTGDTATSTASAVQNWHEATIGGNAIINGAVWTSVWSNDLEPAKTTIQDDAHVTGKIIVQKNSSSVTVEPALEIAGGTLDVTWSTVENPSFVDVNGGDFTASVPEQYLNERFKAELYSTAKNPDAPYSYYESVAAATAAAQPGDTVTQLRTADAEIYTVTLKYNDGRADETVKATAYTEITLPRPSRSGYDFRYWSNGSATYNGGAPYTVTSNVTLTAQWSARSQGGSSSSGSSSTTYSPSLDVSDGGTIKVSPRTPEAGDKVTITPDPDRGYEVDEVIVTDRDGDEIRVTANRDGTYTFTQPRGRVTIEVTFVRAGESVFFDDVPASFWAYDEIAWAYDNGYVNGTSAATFSPNSSITRQQVWMILARLSGTSPASMAAAREWAMANNISDGTNPGNAVTRQQLVALLYRYAQMMGYDNGAREALTSFPDAGTVSGYAQEPMQWSVANGIVAGTSAGTLNPAGTATRAQFAVILYRFWDQVG